MVYQVTLDPLLGTGTGTSTGTIDPSLNDHAVEFDVSGNKIEKNAQSVTPQQVEAQNAALEKSAKSGELGIRLNTEGLEAATEAKAQVQSEDPLKKITEAVWGPEKDATASQGIFADKPGIFGDKSEAKDDSKSAMPHHTAHTIAEMQLAAVESLSRGLPQDGGGVEVMERVNEAKNLRPDSQSIAKLAASVGSHFDVTPVAGLVEAEAFNLDKIPGLRNIRNMMGNMEEATDIKLSHISGDAGLNANQFLKEKQAREASESVNLPSLSGNNA